MPGEGRTTPTGEPDGNPLEQCVVGLESSMKEILSLLCTVASTPPQPPPAAPVLPIPANPVPPNPQGVRATSRWPHSAGLAEGLRERTGIVGMLWKAKGGWNKSGMDMEQKGM